MTQTKTWTCWRDASHEVGRHEFGWPQCKVCRAAPPYHERPSYAEGVLLDLYVPVAGSFVARTVAPRSAIVGKSKGDRVVAYYEGWTNGPMQYAGRDARGLWEAGVEHAAGRMITAYPTIAVISPKEDELIWIGTYIPTTRQAFVRREEVLDAWLK